ncbi:protein YLS3 isoform X1 [Amborella trichopoda]|uniref:protein YLS3 isoform X1 n=1 Tax=Amborella trichopoda TaxID=13333 RepID=UPI0009C15031|nr:protein YLS3 isoform X1 [Amborella trichopoda]|eukprot:XP_020519827.1 protein YLS3 isoform X1 [Amborella trichopoda]
MGEWLVAVGVAVAVVVLGGAGEVGGDLAEDRKECTEQLTGLATCLPYVQGEAASPTKDCCRGFKQVVEKSDKCFCILIKDSTDPNLGIKINTSLAAKLPHSCSTSVNISRCPEILHISPNAPEAQIFKQFASAVATNTSAPASVSSTGEFSLFHFLFLFFSLRLFAVVFAGSGKQNGTSSGSSSDESGASRDERIWRGLFVWCFTCLLLVFAW